MVFVPDDIKYEILYKHAISPNRRQRFRTAQTNMRERLFNTDHVTVERDRDIYHVPWEELNNLIRRRNYLVAQYIPPTEHSPPWMHESWNSHLDNIRHIEDQILRRQDVPFNPNP